MRLAEIKSHSVAKSFSGAFYTATKKMKFLTNISFFSDIPSMFPYTFLGLSTPLHPKNSLEHSLEGI
jgi:hypothetical protein